jgi:hypothetical protein
MNNTRIYTKMVMLFSSKYLIFLCSTWNDDVTMRRTQFPSLMVAMTIAVMIFDISLQQYPQTAQAFPCIGNSAKVYCAGYHDGGIQAHKDFKSGDDADTDEHTCTDSAEYCNGYDRGYSDEEDFR